MAYRGAERKKEGVMKAAGDGVIPPSLYFPRRNSSAISPNTFA
jgi:hypothetical protein